MMSGKIWIESNSFGGSTFKFSIPLEIISDDVQQNKDKEEPRLSEMLYMLL